MLKLGKNKKGGTKVCKNNISVNSWIFKCLIDLDNIGYNKNGYA